jgi:hypothetical protein
MLPNKHGYSHGSRSAATGDKVVVRNSVSSVDLVVLITAEENVCSVLAVEAILAVTAVRGVGAMTAPKVVIVQTAEERVGINAADFLVFFFDQLILVVPAFLLWTWGSLPSLRQD